MTPVVRPASNDVVLIKRLLDLERKHGDEATVTRVKEMARAWVEENT